MGEDNYSATITEDLLSGGRALRAAFLKLRFKPSAAEAPLSELTSAMRRYS
jgi:hypothetical protein